MQKLDVKSKAATILLRNHTDMGYCTGAEFPGQTIRLAIDKLYKLGYLVDSLDGRMIVTITGKQYLSDNHRYISIGK